MFEQVKWAVTELGGGLSATLIVVEFVIIVYLFKRLNESYDKQFEIMQEFGKEQRELQALTNQAIHTSSTALLSNNEILRQFAGKGNQ